MAEATRIADAKALVIEGERTQSVRLPAEFRFSSLEVYIRRDPKSGVVSLSERPFKPTFQDIFEAFDAAGAHDFVVERDRSMPRDVEI